MFQLFPFSLKCPNLIHYLVHKIIVIERTQFRRNMEQYASWSAKEFACKGNRLCFTC